MIGYDLDGNGTIDHVALYIGNNQVAAHAYCYWGLTWNAYASGNPNIRYTFVHIMTSGAPAAPVATAATSITSSSFQANWNASTGATGYYMDVSTSSTFSSYVFNNYNVGNYTAINVNSLLSAGTTYYYRIRAYNGSGTSGNSGTISVTTTGNAPAVPVATAATFVTSSSFQANWNASSGATGYYMDVSTSSTFSSYVFNNYDVGNYTAINVNSLLSAGTTYYYRIRAYNGSGTSGNSGTISVTTTGNAPAVPVATAATFVTSSSFQANWNASSGATGYYMDVSTSSTFSSYVFNNYDVGNYTAINVNSLLSAGTTYYYRIRAYNGSGTSGNSGTISVTTTGNAPAVPVATAATFVTSSSFQANWNASSGATGYYMDVSTSSTFSSYVFNNYNVGNYTAINVNSLLSAGTTYYYRIRAYNGSGTSGNSGTISVTTTGNAPAVPVATAATFVTSSSFQANWNASSGATGYYMDVSTSSTFSTYVFNNYDVGNYTAINVNSLLSAGTTYYYRIRAYNSSGTSGNSGTITVTTLPNPPSAPTATAATSISSSGFTANWNSVSGATGYRLDISTSSTFASFVGGYQDLDILNFLNRTVLGLTGNTTYYYRVRAYNTGGASGNSGTITVVTLPAAPSAPTANAATSVTTSGFVANWSSVSGATGYRLDISTSSTFASFISGYQDLDVGNVASKSVSALSAGTTYYYRVRAYNTGGTGGNSGTITVATLPNPPSAPTANAATSVTSSGFTANWSSASGATGYRLDVSTSSTFASFVSGYQDLDVGNVMNRSVSGLNASTTYYYRVRAYNTGGTSGYSGTISITALPNPPSAPTANAATSVTASSFSANWSSTSGATGYRLDVSTSSTFASFVSGYQDLDVGNVVTKAVSGLSAGTIYYYRVRAYNTGGTSGNSGTISTITIPPAPTANAASGIATNAFTANWNTTSGATGYRLDVSTNSAFSNFVSGNQDLDVGNVLLRSVTALNAGTVYYYRVRAYNGSGTSTSSATITTATAGPAIALTKQGNNLVLSWPTNDSAFKLYYTTNPITMTWISNAVSPSIVAGRYTITNSMTNNFKLYRLKK